MKRTKRKLRIKRKLLLRRTRIFKKYLKIRLTKPLTFFLAALFPFLQAFLASVITIYTNSKEGFMSNLILFGASLLYYTAFVMNAKRANKGSNLGIYMLIFFGALGILIGKLAFK